MIKKKCKICDGSGRVSDFKFRGVFTFADVECSYCHGKGYLEKSNKEKSLGALIIELENLDEI